MAGGTLRYNTPSWKAGARQTARPRALQTRACICTFTCTHTYIHAQLPASHPSLGLLRRGGLYHAVQGPWYWSACLFLPVLQPRTAAVITE